MSERIRTGIPRRTRRVQYQLTRGLRAQGQVADRRIDRKELLSAADIIYRAKNAGRNRTAAYDTGCDDDSELASSAK